MILPWMVKNWIEVANPVSPLANRIFPNPYVHISFEDSWRRFLSNYDLPSRWQIPLEVTVKGEQLDGFLGPLFLLTPLALLALRFREGRQLLLAGLLFGSARISAILARASLFRWSRSFLSRWPWRWRICPGCCLRWWPRQRCRLLAGHVSDLLHCRAPGGSRVSRSRPRCALNPRTSISARTPTTKSCACWPMWFLPASRIFAIGQGGTSYLPRELLIGYHSAANEVLEDILVDSGGARVTSRCASLKFDFPVARVSQAARGSQGTRADGPMVHGRIAHL